MAVQRLAAYGVHGQMRVGLNGDLLDVELIGHGLHGQIDLIAPEEMGGERGLHHWRWLT